MIFIVIIIFFSDDVVTVISVVTGVFFAMIQLGLCYSADDPIQFCHIVV